MEEACRQLAAWQSQGIMLPLSVNVSLLQLLEHDRGEEMLKLIARYRIAPGTLILEVTESCRMDDPQDVMARLRPLREAMIQLARGLSLRIVAEGVENDAQRRWLQAAGVEVLQGHLFGCALPQEAFSARYLSPVREDENL